jgi:hypothetical protein
MNIIHITGMSKKLNHGVFFIKILTKMQIHLIYKHIYCYFHGLNWQDKATKADVDNKVTVLLHVAHLHIRTCCATLFPPTLPSKKNL